MELHLAVGMDEAAVNAKGNRALRTGLGRPCRTYLSGLSGNRVWTKVPDHPIMAKRIIATQADEEK